MRMARNRARALCEPPRKSQATMEVSGPLGVLQWPLLRRGPQIREARRVFRRHPGHLLRLRFRGPACQAAALLDPAAAGAVEPTSGCSFLRDPEHHQRHQ